MTTQKTFRGVIPPIIAPLTPDGSLDADGLCALIDFLIGEGVSGIFVGGTSGEACYLPEQVQLELVRRTLSAVAGRVRTLVGVIEPSTARVIARMRQMEELGADCFVATPAFYLQNSCQDEIIRHYEALSRAVRGDLAVYNIPGTTHVNIKPATLKRLAEFDPVVLYKDSCADFEQVQRDIYALRGTRVSMFNGAEELCAASMVFGAEGCVPGLANFFPRLFIDCCEAARLGDIERASRLQEKIVEIRAALFAGSHWMAAMKYIGEKFGFGCGLSLPVQPLTGDEKRRIDIIIERCAQE